MKNGDLEDGVHNCKCCFFFFFKSITKHANKFAYWPVFRYRPDISNLRSSTDSRGGRNSFSNRSAGDGQQMQQQQPQQQSQQQPPAIQETEQNETVRRQTSVAGEDIKIVIHDVDFDPNIMGEFIFAYRIKTCTNN